MGYFCLRRALCYHQASCQAQLQSFRACRFLNVVPQFASQRPVCPPSVMCFSLLYVHSAESYPAVPLTRGALRAPPRTKREKSHPPCPSWGLQSTGRQTRNKTNKTSGSLESGTSCGGEGSTEAGLRDQELRSVIVQSGKVSPRPQRWGGGGAGPRGGNLLVACSMRPD